jgi:hypothetical protein
MRGLGGTVAVKETRPSLQPHIIAMPMNKPHQAADATRQPQNRLYVHIKALLWL